MSAPHRVHQLPGGARLVIESMPERTRQRGVHVRAVPDWRMSLAGLSFHRAPLFKGTAEEAFVQGDSGAIGVSRLHQRVDRQRAHRLLGARSIEHMNLGLDVLFDIVGQLKLDPADVRRANGHPRELRMYRISRKTVQNLFEELIWPGHPLGRDIGWDGSQCRGLSREDILEYAARTTVAYLVIGAADRLDERATIAEVTERSLASVQTWMARWRSPPPGPLVGSHVLVAGGRPSRPICLGAPAPSATCTPTVHT